MKRLLTAALIVLMISTVFVSAIHAATFSDINDAPWAEGYVNYLSGKKILNGYEDGTFKPNNVVKRSEFIKMMTETFGLTETKSIGYADVPANEWYYTYISKAAAQGFILEYGSYLNPNAEITREEAAALLARYLGLTDMADSSAYPDYSLISAQYREYVLQATKAGLFSGYEDRTFRPQKTLTRAEALTILYRAAGVIYSETASGKDPAAAPTNAIVTKGLTVYNATIDGTVYITEGTSGQKVTFDNCVLNADVYVRGSAEVVFNNSSVKNLIVEPTDGKKATITAMGSSIITKMSARSVVDVSIESNAKVSSLALSAYAQGSKVTGKGTLSSVNVGVTGFTSEMIPAEYVIGAGITATFNGLEYTSAGAAISGTGFDGKSPTIEKSANANITFAFKTKAEGTIYYSLAAKRTSTPTAASIRSEGYSIDVGSSKQGTATLSYAYARLTDSDLVAVFYDRNGNAYEPVRLFSNEDSGLLGTTTVKGSSIGGVYTATYTISSQVEGKAYVVAYLRNETTSLTDAKIISYATNRASERGLVGGVIDMPKAGTTYTFELSIPSSYTTNIWDTAIVFVTANGTQQMATYSTITSITESFAAKQTATGNGFEVNPRLLADDTTSSPPVTYTKDTISYKTQSTGKVYYYYTNTATAPTAAAFHEAWRIATLGSQFAVIGGNSGQQELAALKTNNTYAYIVFSYEDANGNFYTPVILARSVTAQTGGTGFTGTVSITVSGTTESLVCTPIAAGNVYYYYTTSPTPPSASSFQWQLGSYRVNAANVSVSITLPATLAANTHLAVMFIDDNGNEYQPIVIARPNTTGGGGTGNGSNTTSTGIQNAAFYQTPEGNYVLGNTTAIGTVYYYYANASDSIPSSSTFMTSWNNAGTYKGTASTSGVFNFYATPGTNMKLVMMFVDMANVYYVPTSLSLS